MVLTREQIREQEAATRKAAEAKAEALARELAEAQNLGRGCRERRQTRFLEEDYIMVPRNSGGRRSGGSKNDDGEELEFTSRRPQREAAKKALERLRGEESSSDESDHSPRNRRNDHSAGPRRPPKPGDAKRQTFDATLIDSESGDDISTDSSNGVLDYDPRPDVEKAIKRRTSINDLMQKSIVNMTSKRDRSGAPKHSQDKSDGGNGDNGEKAPDAEALGDITPLNVDPSITFQSVGGLPQHILQLREMVLMPLMYPKVMDRLKLQPPRGVLFVGPPGTGKTLMARALANEGMLCADRKVSFFMRKGADILSKWVGESEKQLRLLFDEAKKREPSIIFFDEIDGLAPVRHSKQEQSHAALVSTLLALMDGLDSRGQVIVIGATNRPDTIDPALRRPGRFDRELRFPLPDEAARRHILRIQLGDGADDESVEYLLRHTEGWSGADIQAVTTEASLSALRRTMPQIYVSSHRLQVSHLVDNVRVEPVDFQVAVRRMQPSMKRSTTGGEVTIDPHLEVLCAKGRDAAVEHVSSKFVPAALALRERNRRCDDLQAATVELTAVPPPPVSSGFVLGVVSSSSMVAEAVAALTVRHFHFFSRAVHLPNLMAGHGSTSSVAQEVTEQSSADASNFPSLVQSLVGCTPATVLLLGLGAWVSQLPEDEDEQSRALGLFRYNLMMLTQAAVLVVIPTDELSVFESVVDKAFFPGHVVGVEHIADAVEDDARRKFWELAAGVAASALHRPVATPAEWEQLQIDNTPLPQPKPPKRNKDEARKHWERVCYKRRQLRHLLFQWMNQFTTGTRFKLLLNKDLDLEEGSQELKQWRNHTRTTRIGMMDILEKLENAEYNALSEYNTDIETLVKNVTSFYNTRDQHSQRYRGRATELKETTMLNNYKINKNLVKFCEEHRGEDEPSDSDSSSSSSEDESSDSDVELLTGGKKNSTTEEEGASPKPTPADAAAEGAPEDAPSRSGSRKAVSPKSGSRNSESSAQRSSGIFDELKDGDMRKLVTELVKATASSSTVALHQVYTQFSTSVADVQADATGNDESPAALLRRVIKPLRSTF